MGKDRMSTTTEEHTMDNYQVLIDTYLPQPLQQFDDGREETRNVFRAAGTVITGQLIASFYKEAYNKGDAHVRSLIKKVSDQEADQIAQQNERISREVLLPPEYDLMKAAEILQAISSWDDLELAAAKAHEEIHEQRITVMEALSNAIEKKANKEE